MRIKKLLCMSLSIMAIAGGIVGCGSDTSSTTGTTTGTAAATATKSSISGTVIGSGS